MVLQCLTGVLWLRTLRYDAGAITTEVKQMLQSTRDLYRSRRVASIAVVFSMTEKPSVGEITARTNWTYHPMNVLFRLRLRLSKRAHSRKLECFSVGARS
jgi:hypothetical protein